MKEHLDRNTILKQSLILWGVMLAVALIAACLKFVPFTYEIPKQKELYFTILFIQAMLLLIIAVGMDRFLFRKIRMKKILEISPSKLKTTVMLTTLIGTMSAQAAVYWGNITVIDSDKLLYPMSFYITSLLLFGYFYPWKWRILRNI